MKNIKKLFAAVLVAGAATFAFAAPAHADSVHIGLNLGGGGYYQPAPVPVERVVYAPVYQQAYYRPAPAPIRVGYYDTWHHRRQAWVRPGWREPHVAYGYGGRGW